MSRFNSDSVSLLLLGKVLSEWLCGNLRFCGLEMEGKLLELAGLKVLGELLIELVVAVVSGKKGGTLMILELLEFVVVVVNGLIRLGLELNGESVVLSPDSPSPLALVVRLGGSEYSYP